MTYLIILLLIPLIGAVFTGLAGRVNANLARGTATFFMAANLLLAYLLSVRTQYAPVAGSFSWIPSFGVTFSIEADWLSSVLILLTTILGLVAVLASWREIKERVASFHVWLLILQFAVLLVFLARDLMLFYLGWELMLAPVLFLVGGWGTGRKEYAALKFVIFTFTGSIFMLASFLYVYFRHADQTGAYTFQLAELMRTALTEREQAWVFLGLLLGFGVKIPLLPLHTWLIDAYPAAPTAGSLLLSGVLSKTGAYGLFRFGVPFAGPEVLGDFRVLIITLAVIGIFYGAWCAFAQFDLKRLIAYSSLSHLSFIMIGLFLDERGSVAGFSGAVLQMVNHGFTTAALFILAGMIQERYRTRDFDMLGGLWDRMPAVGGFLLFFCLASLGLPGTGNFIGELFIAGGAFQISWILGTLVALGVFFGALYSLKLFTATMHGPVTALAHDHSEDTTPRESFTLMLLVVLLLGIGFFPRVITAPFYEPIPTSQAAAVSSLPSINTQNVTMLLQLPTAQLEVSR